MSDSPSADSNTASQSTTVSDEKRDALKNQGAEAMFSALNWLQEHVPDAEVSFDMPCEQQLTVTRNGVRYAVKQLGSAQYGYVYGVGAQLPMGRFNDIKFPTRQNACESYAGAVLLLAKTIMADPRQPDLKPWNKHTKHISFQIQAAPKNS